MRSTKEWEGRSDDAMPPPSIRLRIFEAHDGRCHISGLKIRPGDAWDLDHVRPLWDGGENRETNLAPALRKFHRQKSAADKTIKAKSDQKKISHLGIRDKRGWRNSGLKKKLTGEVIDRETGKQVWP